ncbi:MAG: tRNA (N(6)-L-threonylcarbamoyladenosine(37)-C(2))-methylthiotransferase MtaB [Clostridia bacterium]|nr:tRNA (N(6)-L-threonylcarbamoyladenosine(37)-C(2))-methylthiotransferase MtaB [Clostridia bacterium]
MNIKRTVSFYTLGCRANQYESDAVAEELESRGFEVVPFGKRADVCIINTCSVTAESDRKSRQMIRRALTNSYAENIIVTGCSAQIFPDEIRNIKSDLVIVGNSDKKKIPDVAVSLAGGKRADDILNDIDFADYDGLTITHARRARAYVKIEDGCENKCAYCIIPKGRGKIRSKDEGVILDEVKSIAKSCPEIILTGIETASYGKDRGKAHALEELLKKVDSIDGVDRLTLGSLDPNILKESFLSTAASLPSFLPHLHISVQSGSSTVLARMRRKYNASQAAEALETAKKIIPGIFFSADVIVGFPGETEEEFNETVDFVRRIGFMHLHIFPFSRRAGTEAATMPGQLSQEVKYERAARLSEIQKKIKRDILDAYVSQYENGGDGVLFEQKADGVNIGHSRHYVEVRVQCEEDLSGRTVPVKLTGNDGEVCYGELL